MKKIKLGLLTLSIIIAGCAVSGCAISSFTYGVGQTIPEQLYNELADASSFGDENTDNSVDLSSRPELVVPVRGAKTALPLPYQLRAGQNRSSGVITSKQRQAIKRQHNRARQAGVYQDIPLSTPPLSYLKPYKTAPIDDLGDDEIEKERAKRKTLQGGESRGRGFW